MVKAIFFDVDGTLVSFETRRIPQTALDALAQLKEKGIKLFLATGRHPLMLPYVRSAFPFDGEVTVSGQYCTWNGQVLRSDPLSPQAVEEVVQAAKEEGFPCMMLEADEMYQTGETPFIRAFVESLDMEPLPIRDPEYALGHTVYQIIVFLRKEQEHQLLDRAPELKTTRWNPEFLDVIPTTGGKDVGIQAVMDHFGLTREEVMAFGDGENDLSMLLHAGIGVAMGTASEDMKAQADFVTGTVDEDGIVTALRQYNIL